MIMNVKKTPDGKEEMFEIGGRILNIESEKFKKRFERFCQKKQKRALLDISRVDFIDSLGLGAIVGFHTMLQKEGRELVIINTNTNPNSYMRRLFDMTSLDIIFKVINEIENL